MKTLQFPLAIAALTCLLTTALAQNTPTDIPKKELPKKALCAVCAAKGGGEDEEKPASGVRYKGTSYYFCKSSELIEFKKEPDSWVPLPIPRFAPDFKLKTLSDKEVSKDSFKGKILLLDFWATWCKPCVATMPELQTLFEKYAEKGLAILGVSIDEKGAKVVKPFIAKRKFAYPIAIDGGENPAWQAYRVKGIPAMFLIDQKGQIVKQWLGKPDKKEVEEAVSELLK